MMALRRKKAHLSPALVSDALENRSLWHKCLPSASPPKYNGNCEILFYSPRDIRNGRDLPIDNRRAALIIERRKDMLPAAAPIDDGLFPQIGDTRLVVLRSKQQLKRNLPCARCAETRGVKRSRHFLRIRRDRQLDIEWRFLECWFCGNRI